MDLLFIAITFVISAYLVRHYVFTITVLRQSKTVKVQRNIEKILYEPTVSILIPAHNEQEVIGKLLEKTVNLSYPESKLEVIVIDDASTDNTGKIAEEFAKYSQNIKVLHRDKTVGGKGKAAALNAALKRATGEIVLCFDADYLPNKNIVEKLVEKFSDPKVGAVQGRPVVINEPLNIVTRLVALERIGGYRVDQEARDVLGLVPQFGGTVGGFRRSAMETLGGFDESILAEDTDLTFQLYLAGYKIRYIGDAECYEEAVSTWKAYWRQRHRWAKGHMQVCFKHSFKVLKSSRMNKKQKIDGLLVLFIYFLPIITLVSFFIGTFLIFSHSNIATLFWLIIPISIYSFVGNYAPFFEIGVGAYLDGRTRIQWLMPFLIFSFFYNILICTKALFDVLLGKLIGDNNHWRKTEHFGRSAIFINSIEEKC